jgi:hypothetical protein
LCILVFAYKRGMLLESTQKLNELSYYDSVRNVCNFCYVQLLLQPVSFDNEDEGIVYL